MYDGKVVYSGWRGGYGKTVIVDHGKGIHTIYAHLYSIVKWKGSDVKQNEVIGLMGNTGRSTGTHLHFEVRIYENQKYSFHGKYITVDPKIFF